MARSSKRRDPTHMEGEDEQAEPEPDSNRRHAHLSKSATPTTHASQPENEPEQEDGGLPEPVASQRAPRKSKAAALEKRIWTADAPKRKSSQSQAQEEAAGEESKHPSYAEPGNRPQRPKPKRLAAAKYRAPGTEDLDNEIDPPSNSQRTSERPSRATKPGTYRDEHRKDLLALSKDTDTPSGSSSSAKSRNTRRERVEEQVYQGDDDSPESSGDASGSGMRGEDNEIAEDGEESESSSDDLAVKDVRTAEKTMSQEIPEWIGSDKEDLEQETLPRRRKRSSVNAGSNRRHELERNDGPPASPSPSVSEEEQPTRSQVSFRATSSSKRSVSRRYQSSDSPDDDSLSDHAPKVHAKKKKCVESDDDSHLTRRSQSERRTGADTGNTARKRGAASASHGKQVAPAELRDREHSAKTHPDKHRGRVLGVKRPRDRDQEIPRWSDDDMPVKQRRASRPFTPDIGQSETLNRPKESGSAKPLDDDDSQSDPGSEDGRIDIIHKKGTKLGILAQRPRVKKTLNAAIQMCQADILLHNAFPEGTEKYNTIARNALIKCAGNLGYTELVKRLKRDDDYALTLAAIPVDRIPAFRSQVRDAVHGAIQSTYHLRPGDVAHVEWLQWGFRYIYPHDYEKDKVSGNEPFSLPIFADGLRAAYFKTPRSFGWRVVEKFSSSFPEKPEEKEIPVAMLALVSTAVFAAIDDHRSSSCEASEFTTNSYSAAYKRVINILSSLKERSLEAYHDVLHDLYKAVCGGTGSSTARGANDADDLVFLQVPTKRHGS
ncbi:hypothetical protein GY45DRAFT_1376158 [Cubamyces sp. BRFM 1775]|nr:hypothetical protein GY45DRAFT_1376158 [Cubamyces sp. BRFM 1775]